MCLGLGKDFPLRNSRIFSLCSTSGNWPHDVENSGGIAHSYSGGTSHMLQYFLIVQLHRH